MNLFLDVATTLYEAKSFYDVGKIILSILQKLASDQIISGKIGIYDKDNDDYKIYYNSDEKAESEYPDKETYKIVHSSCKYSEIKYFSRIVADTKNKLIIQNNHSKESLKIHSAQKQFEPHAMMWVPLVYNDDFLGIISLASKPINSFTDEIVQTIEGIAKLTSIKVYELFASDNLIKSESRFRIMMEKLPDAYIIGDITGGRDHGFIDCNQAALDMLRMTTKEQLITKNRIELSPERQPDGQLSSEKSEAIIAECLSKGSHKVEWLHQRADGENFFVEIFMTIVNYHDKTFLHTVWRDINERKQTEAALLEATENLKATLNAIPDLMFEVDKSGLICDYRAPAHDLLYTLPENFLGKKISEVLPEDVSNIISEAISKASQFGWHRGSTYSLDLPTGKCWFELSISVKDKSDLDNANFIVLARNITERKRAETKLRESEQKFKSIYHQSPIGQELYDYEGKLLDVNPACLEIFGIESAEEVKGFNLFDDPNVPSDAKEKLLSGESVRFETCFDFDAVKSMSLYKTRKTGLCYLDCSITQWFFHEDTESGYLVHVIDITEQINSETIRRENEKRLKKAEIIGKLGNIEIDLITGKVIWSDQVYLIYGLERKTFVPTLMNFIDLVHPDDVNKVDGYFNAQLKKYGNFDIEYRIINKQGETRWVRSVAEVQFDEEQRPVKLFGVFQDISERKQAEEELSKRERDFHTLVENSTDMIVRFDTNFRHIYCNSAVEKELAQLAENTPKKESMMG